MAVAVERHWKDLSPSAVVPEHRDLYYAGRWHAPKSGRYVETIDPALGEAIVPVADAGADDAEAAIRAAHDAFEGWRKLKPLERAGMLKGAAATLRAHAEELAMLDALNTGNPVAEM